MTTQNPVYASQAKPWLKYYAQKYIDQTLPTLSAFDYVCHRNRNHLNDTALDLSLIHISEPTRRS